LLKIVPNYILNYTR